MTHFKHQTRNKQTIKQAIKQTTQHKPQATNATRNAQRTTRNTQHTTHNTQRTTHTIQNARNKKHESITKSQ